jgi:hypothetical protein
LILNSAQVSSILINEGNIARFGGVWSQSFTGIDRQYVSTNNYNTTSGDYDSEWDNLFQGVITQYRLTEDAAATVNNRLLLGIAQVGRAQHQGLAADLWGDVPFDEVGRDQDFPTPKFEPQIDVYTKVQTLLDSAIANLESETGASPGTKDIFYQGDADSWIAAAYTLKARFYLHTKEYENALTAAASGIASPSGSMYAPHGSTYLADFNVWYSFLTYDRPGYMNADGAFSVDLLDATSAIYRGNSKTNETARFIFLYFDNNNPPDFYPGINNTGGIDPNVLSDFDWGNDPSENGFFAANERFPIVTYQENLLIIAEANIKQLTPNLNAALDALNTFRQYLGDESSTYIRPGYLSLGFEYEDYSLADFAAGGIANPGSLSAQDALLKEIIEERYITFIGQTEQFNDVRRTKNLLGITPVTGTKLPQRFLYPQSEIDTNPNTPKLSSGDLFTETPVNATPY